MSLSYTIQEVGNLLIGMLIRKSTLDLPCGKVDVPYTGFKLASMSFPLGKTIVMV